MIVLQVFVKCFFIPLTNQMAREGHIGVIKLSVGRWKFLY